MTVPSTLRRSAVALLLLFVAALPAAAAEAAPAAAAGQPKVETAANPYGDLSDQHFWLSLGAFLPSFNTTARLDSERAGVPGATIDSEDDLGLDARSTNYRLDFVWHIAPRHALAARYFEFKRSATSVIDADIQYGDVLFAANTTLDADSKIGYYGLAYHFSFTQRDGLDVYLISGFDTLSVSAALAGSGTITSGGGTLGAFNGEKNGGITIPVPVIGIGLSVELTHRLFLHEDFEFFGLKVQGIDGRLTDNRISLDWHPFRHIGFGLGYDRMRLKVAETDGQGSDFDFDWELSGGRVYVTGTF
jgi:hypothetical protein